MGTPVEWAERYRNSMAYQNTSRNRLPGVDLTRQ